MLLLVYGPQPWVHSNCLLNSGIFVSFCFKHEKIIMILCKWMIRIARADIFVIFLGGSESRLVEAANKQLNTLPFYHSFWNRTTKPSLVWKSSFYITVPLLSITGWLISCWCVGSCQRTHRHVHGQQDVKSFFHQ